MGTTPIRTLVGGVIIFGGPDGFGQFIHRPGADHTQEGFDHDRSGDFGGVYGRYQITRYTAGTLSRDAQEILQAGIESTATGREVGLPLRPYLA